MLYLCFTLLYSALPCVVWLYFALLRVTLLYSGTKRFVEECREYLFKIEDLKAFMYTEPSTGEHE
jgi:hypothetical protein